MILGVCPLCGEFNNLQKVNQTWCCDMCAIGEENETIAAYAGDDGYMHEEETE
jgi:hypothetical protein